MTARNCRLCGEEKTLKDFYKHPNGKDGRDTACKECVKARVRKNRRDKIDYYTEYERKRASLPHRVEARNAYQKTKAGKESIRKSRDRYVEKNPKKRKASHIVGNAVRDGKLIKEYKCSVCGRDDCRIHGHHDDYDKPLEVRWLCPKCHWDWHKENGEGLNAK